MSAIRLLEIPKWGLSMEEGTVLEWLIDEGDDFDEGQEICEIESSKIVNVLEAPFAGTLRRIIAGPGISLPVQATIAVSAPRNVPESEINAFLAEQCGATTSQPDPSVANDQTLISQTKPAANETPPAAEAASLAPRQIRESRAASFPEAQAQTLTSIRIPASLTGESDDADVHTTPRARARAVEWGVNLSRIEGSGRAGRVSLADIRRAVREAGGSVPEPALLVSNHAAQPASQADDRSVRATPLARRLAHHEGINLLDCRSSGRHGRVTRADVDAEKRRIRGPEKPSALSAPGARQLFPDTDEVYEDRPLGGMRKTIAARLRQSKQDAPHFRLTIDCQLDALMRLRQQINNDNPAARLSVNDFLVKAAALALIEVPQCNVQFNGETIRQFEHAHVAVAVALESGLITPIVRAADTKGLLQISSELTDLVTRAKANTLRTADFTGGSFTLSNLGMHGIRQFDAIINPPQAAILAIGAGEQRVVVDDGEMVVARLLTVTLCSDHRIIDGALGARFLAAFRAYVEQPAMLLS